jgi:hypothetical protein
LNPHGIATTSPSNWRVCHSTTRASCVPVGAYVEGLSAPPRLRRYCCYFVDPGVAGAAGFPAAGAGTTGFAFLGACFVAGITLDVGAESKILPVTRRAEASARKIEVEKKIIASAHVALVSALPAPLAPNTVWLEPPNTAPTSAPLPCCSRIMMHIATQTIT